MTAPPFPMIPPTFSAGQRMRNKDSPTPTTLLEVLGCC